MKVLIVLCLALLVACSAGPSGYAYSPYTPYRSWAPSSYFFSAPQPLSRFAYAVSEPSVISYNPSPAYYSYNAIPAPAVKYVAPAPLVAAPSAPLVAVAPTPAIKSQYHSQDSLGQAKYGHDEPGQSHHAIQDAAGNKYGTFSYIKPDGQVSITQYSADHEGYKVASNDLPVGPGPAPAPAPIQPIPVQPIAAAPAFADAPAVVSAPVFADAPAVVAAPVVADAPIVSAPVYADAPAIVSADPSGDTVEVESVEFRRKRSTAPERSSRNKRSAVLPNGFLADTPEVAQAKTAHFAEHAKRSAPAYYSAPVAYSALPYSYSAYSYSTYPYSAYPYSAYPYSAYPYSAYPYSAYPYSAYPFSTHAATVVKPDGYLADTPEVAAAKAAHFAEHAAVLSRARRHTPALGDRSKRSAAHTPASTKPLVKAVPVVPVVPAGYAPGYTAVAYSRPVDPAAPIVPIVPVAPVVPVVAPGQAYAYAAPAKK